MIRIIGCSYDGTALSRVVSHVTTLFCWHNSSACIVSALNTIIDACWLLFAAWWRIFLECYRIFVGTHLIDQGIPSTHVRILKWIV